MKINYKSLTKKYVSTYSDIGFGVLGRNEAVIALKQIMSCIKTPKLLKSIDKLKPGKNPYESLMVFIDWLKEKYPSIYFRSSEGKSYFGYTEVDTMKRSILAFPVDFLPVLGRMDRKLANLALRACYAFSGYHTIGEPAFGNRLNNEDWIMDSLEDTITNGPRNPSDAALIEQKGFRETWDSYQKEYPKYCKRFNSYAKNPPSISDVSKDLYNFKCDERLQFVIDILNTMMSLCHGKSIMEYSDEALNVYLELNDYNKDREGSWIIDDGWPLTLEDRIMFVWGGEDSNGNDYNFYEIESAANSFAGEFGYTEYSIDLEIKEGTSLDDLITSYKNDQRFFVDLEAVFIRFDKMRNEIVHGNLKNEMKNERQLQSSSSHKNIQTPSLFEHVY